MNRIIPATMATQHPDNASAPYWERDGNGFISTREEVVECASAFYDLDCQEFMWDWEGKYVDEAIADRLFHDYYSYFRKYQLGKDKFLTFRIPNTKHEKGYSLARAFMAILTAEAFARDLSFHTPPLFEVILPMAESADNIISIQKTFIELAIFKQRLFKERSSFRYLRVIPLFEDVEHLINCRSILNRYVWLHKKQFRKKPDYLRIHIARSDPALNCGLVPAVVAGKAALSEQYRFSAEQEIPIFPAIGVGALLFRGGLTPDGVGHFLRQYSGLKTVYIQSAFRYDFPLPLVRRAIRTLNRRLPKSRPEIYQPRHLTEITRIIELFKAPYRQTVKALAATIEKLSRQFPARRERKLHSGFLGYARAIGNNRLPRAIPFTGIFYSLGIPPELIGTGRGLDALAKTGINLEQYYKNFRSDIVRAGQYLNRENLAWLARCHHAWRQIARDVELLEKHLHLELGPKSGEAIFHRQSTTKALRLWRAGRSITNEILTSGKLRRSLG